jgi:hypothetical protein
LRLAMYGRGRILSHLRKSRRLPLHGGTAVSRRGLGTIGRCQYMWPPEQSICLQSPAVSLTQNGCAEIEELLHAPTSMCTVVMIIGRLGHGHISSCCRATSQPGIFLVPCCLCPGTRIGRFPEVYTMLEIFDSTRNFDSNCSCETQRIDLLHDRTRRT